MEIPLSSRGQDLGDGVWSVLAALLPRTAALQVDGPYPPALQPGQRGFERLACPAALPLVHCLARW